MKATPQQQTILTHIKNNYGLVKVNSVAGSGKTTLLVAAAKTLEKPYSTQKVHNQQGLYLAYTRSVATESKGRFPTYMKCSTTHALAYQPTVIQHKLKLGQFTYRNISEKIKYDVKCSIVDHIRTFCLSDHLSFDSYAVTCNLPKSLITVANKYLHQMSIGKTDCTHDFYLKMFHLLLVDGSISYPEFDFIALDEAGDLNPVTLAIFNALPAKRKAMVGDPFQNIFGFNHTINCFEEMKNEGVLFPMSQSFRVADHIATRIEGFCQKYLDPSMEFKGVKLGDETIKTKLYISRTNAALIGKMMELNNLGIQYGLTRTAKQIFQIPLMLCGLKHRGFISIPEYKHIQDEVNHYYENSTIRDNYTSALAYVRDCNEDDVQLQTALTLIIRHGKKAIIDCFEEATKHEKLKQNYMLGTGHSTKGLEADQVEIAEDLNKSISALTVKANDFGIDSLTTEETGAMNLYYVACSRAKKRLINANYL